MGEEGLKAGGELMGQWMDQAQPYVREQLRQVLERSDS